MAIQPDLSCNALTVLLHIALFGLKHFKTLRSKSSVIVCLSRTVGEKRVSISWLNTRILRFWSCMLVCVLEQKEEI